MRLSRLISLLGVSIMTGLSLAAEPPKPPEPKAAPVITKISGPYTHDNLSIFLLHGSDAISGRKFLTLNEALEQKKIIVYETSNVNMLAVENTADVEIFIQTGDIVKGGKQDRLMAHDMIVPPKSGKIPIPSFCVESGRWSQRGLESATMFALNPGLGGNALKLAANQPGMMPVSVGRGAGSTNATLATGGQPGSQSEVWNKVRLTQMKLQRAIGKNVADKESPSSYQLTVEDKDLLERLAKYEQELANILKEKSDVIGIAYAINGRVEGAEVFACAELCVKQWPKMLKSCAVDALAEFNAKKNFKAPATPLVQTFLKEATGPVKEVAQALAGGVPVFIGMPPNPSFPNPSPNQPGVQQRAATADPKPAEPPKPAPVCILQCDQKSTLMVES